jgi:micrococcal nuclease
MSTTTTVKRWVAALMCFCTTSYAAVPETAKVAHVMKVIDGDTLIVDLNGHREHVRLIGIDTPEARPNHRSELQAQERHVDQKTILQLGNRASTYTRELLPKKTTVFLEFDVSRRDKYQRLLAYAWISRGNPAVDTMVNEEILKAGYAYTLTVPPNLKYRQRLAQAFAEGRREKRGLWR